MFSRLHNELQLTFTIATASPLAIRAGKASGIDPVLPDMQVVRDAQGRPFIPGSSLKGVIRSRVEQILRSIHADYACDPFGHNSCGRRLGKRLHTGPERYQAHCYACRLFGSTAIGGRVAFADAPPADGHTPVTGERHSVAIDRRTGGQHHSALFTPEVVEEGRFVATARLTNFALWQVLVLLQALQDLDEGFITLGGGSSRGFGRVRLNLPEAHFIWRDLRKEAPPRLQGYSDRDKAPGPLPGQWRRAAVGWQLTWLGVAPLLGPSGALTGLTLEQALQLDVTRSDSATGGGTRGQRRR